MQKQLLKNILLDPSFWTALLVNIGTIYWFINETWTNEHLFLYFLLNAEIVILILCIRASLHESHLSSKIFVFPFLFFVCNGFFAIYIFMFFNGRGSLTFGETEFATFEAFVTNLFDTPIVSLFMISLGMYFVSQLGIIVRDVISDPENKPRVLGILYKY
jgi:hypothetical protein